VSDDDTPAGLFDYPHSMLVDRERIEAFKETLKPMGPL
jgi:hypothetical protein